MEAAAMEHIEFVVVTSDEPWGDIWHTQLHYAHQLSKRYQVYYFDPPLPWKPSNLFRIGTTSREVSERLTVIRYFNFIPSALGKVALRINDFVNERLLLKMMKKNHGKKHSLVWHFDPFRSFYTLRKKGVKHVYHVVDPIAGSHLDVEQSKCADVVVITSPKFSSHYKALNTSVVQIAQGADTAFLREPEVGIEALPSKDSILLLGTLSDEIDFTILKNLAKRFVGKLVIIGPDNTRSAGHKEQFRELISIKGVTWLGPMNPSGFRKHLQACRLGIIAYDNSKHDRNNLRSPLKVISYLAAGKSIISNIDCEIPSLMGRAIFKVGTEDEYFELIDKSFRNELPFDQMAVDSYLKSIEYDELLRIIFDKLSLPLAPKK